MYGESLEVVAAQEPWRQRIGHPEAVDDPMWSAADAELCQGEVEWEGEGSKHWVCQTCGYIGWCTHTAHRAPQHPVDMLRESRAYFVATREQPNGAFDPVTKSRANLQADFVTAVVLRATAGMSPRKLREFIEKLSRP